jgi:nucleoside-diphosphate-sugar epimerase
MGNSEAILVTGADGYLGSTLARLLLQNSPETALVLWVRSGDRAEFQIKVEKLKAVLNCGASDQARVSFATGDLTSEACFDAVDSGTISSIVHSAAVTRFNVDAETAQSVNVMGTKRVVEFAKKCRRLEQLCQVSSVYASGMSAGVVLEDLVDDTSGFANHYEESKHAAERAVIDGGSQLPWTIVRVATIFADDPSGAVTQYNAVHNTLKLLYYGLISVVPGNADTPLYLITGDFAAGAVASVLKHGSKQNIYHACYRRQECTTLGRFVDLAFETFATDPGFKKRRILKPLFTDLEAFNVLSEAVTTGFSDGITKQAISSVAPFARQLFIDKDVKNDKLRQLMDHYAVPDADELVRRTCKFLCQSKWGRSEVGVTH